MFGQNIGTVKVLVLSPKTIEVSEVYLSEYSKHKEEVLLNRPDIKKDREKEKDEHI
jgi:hypothetical protein